MSAFAFPFLFPFVLVQLIWFLHSHRIRIVNLHYPIDNFFYFAICRRLLPIRLVTSLHGGDAFYKGQAKEQYSRVFRMLLRASDLIILPSDAYRKILVDTFPSVHDKTVFIHNGVNPAQFSSPANPPKGGRYILCVGDHREYKGIDLLLRAAKTLLAEDRSLKVVLAGDGPQRSDLEQLALSLGIREQTEFLGLQPSSEIARLLHGCEVLAVPSREESFCMAVLEAMVCRKPVVASAVGGIPEILEHEKSGILVEPENIEALAKALRRVLADGELRKTLAENAYTRVMERFCLKHTGTAYEAAFVSLIDRKPPAPHSSSEISATS
jgi:glycosyltransferase involved in cell wall biosynthesis